MKDFTTFAIAPHLAGITKQIADFYCGSVKQLRSTDNGEFTVHDLDGTQLSTIVIPHRSGYRFGFRREVAA